MAFGVIGSDVKVCLQRERERERKRKREREGGREKERGGRS